MRAEEDERGRGKTERGRMVRGEKGGGGRRENKGESGERSVDSRTSHKHNC